MNVEEALSGTHELRAIVRADTPESLGVWEGVLRWLQQRDGCVTASLHPVEPVIVDRKMEVPADGPLAVEDVLVNFEELSTKHAQPSQGSTTGSCTLGHTVFFKENISRALGIPEDVHLNEHPMHAFEEAQRRDSAALLGRAVELVNERNANESPEDKP